MAAHSQVLVIPSEYSSLIPDKQLSITNLIKTTLPAQSSALITHAACDAFSNKEPNKDLTCLMTRHVPPMDWLNKLEKDFGQAWFNGARSIQDF
jgi:hypothetical protein